MQRCAPRAFDDLKKLYRDGLIPPDAVPWGDFDNNLAFMEGRAAIVINGLSIDYKRVQDKNPLAAVTKEVPLSGAWVDNAGGESNFIFKLNPQKEAPGKDLLHYIMKNNETAGSDSARPRGSTPCRSSRARAASSPSSGGRASGRPTPSTP